MPCNNNILNGAPGTTAQFRVTQDNGETLWGHLTDLDRNTGAQTGTDFSSAALRLGIAFPLVAGHSYHFLIIKMPSAGSIKVQAKVPNNVLPPCTDTGRFIGPWIIRV